MDERQMKIGVKTCAATISIAYIYILVETFYKFFKTHNIEDCAWEIGLLVLIPFTILFFARKDESILLPKKISGEELPIENDRKSKKIRIKQYLIDSLGFSIGMIVISIIVTLVGNIELDFYVEVEGLSKISNTIISLSIEFISLFIISYVLTYLWGEYQIKKYNNELRKMEGEDNE